MTKIQPSIVVAIIACIIAVGAIAAYSYERNRAPGVEIRLDQKGFSIEQR
jgi:hypothetical protein